MKGKELCEVLKRFRQEIAENNGIEYTPHPCHHEGDCEGTCPLCEQEVAFLYEELMKRANQGMPICTESRLLDELNVCKSTLDQVQFGNKMSYFSHFVFLIDQSELVDAHTAKSMEKTINETLSILKHDPYFLEMAKVSIVTFGDKIEQLQFFKDLEDVKDIDLTNGKGKYNLNIVWDFLSDRILSQKNIISRTTVLIFTAGYDEETLDAMFYNKESYEIQERFRVISFKKENCQREYAVYYQDFRLGSLFRTSGSIAVDEGISPIEELPPPPMGEINIVI